MAENFSLSECARLCCLLSICYLWPLPWEMELCVQKKQNWSWKLLFQVCQMCILVITIYSWCISSLPLVPQPFTNERKAFTLHWLCLSTTKISTPQLCIMCPHSLPSFPLVSSFSLKGKTQAVKCFLVSFWFVSARVSFVSPLLILCVCGERWEMSSFLS